MAALSTVACSTIWFLPRTSLFAEHLMLCDDYVFSTVSDMYDVYFFNEHRPLGGLYPMLGQALIPDFFASSVPLYLNGILAGLMGVTFLHILRLFGTPDIPSWLLVTGVLVHPAVNDFTAWNSVGFHIIACITALAGIALAWDGRKWSITAGAGLLTWSILTYQLYIPVAGALSVLLFVHHGCVNREWYWKKFLAMVGAQGFAALSFIFYVRIVSPALSLTPDVSSTTSAELDLSGSFHQAIALYLNVFCTPGCYWLGIKSAMQTWYLIVGLINGLAIARLGYCCLKRRISKAAACLLAAVWVSLPLLTSIPLWFSSIYTDWRISMVILLPQMFIGGSMLATASRRNSQQTKPALNRHNNWPILVSMAIAVVLLVPPTIHDCRLRLSDFRHDQSIAAALHSAPERLGMSTETHRVYLLPSAATVLELDGSECMFTEGSRAVVSYSTLSYPLTFPYTMLKWHGIDAETTDAITLKTFSGPRIEECVYDRVGRLPYIEHFPDESISVVVCTEQHKSWTLKKTADEIIERSGTTNRRHATFTGSAVSPIPFVN